MTVGFKVRDSQPRCFAVGCRDFVEERVFDRPWCSNHAVEIKLAVAERNYRDFIQGMREQGIEGEPVIQAFGIPVEDRRCAIPGCKIKTIAAGGDLFSPFKNPGMVWACTVHEQILQRVVRRNNGHRLLHELSLRREMESNRERLEREKAIRSAYKKYFGRPRYSEHVCQDLQRDHIKMRARWLERWKSSLQLRFEPFEWHRAYQDKRIRPTIQKYISKICKSLRVRPI